MAAVALSAAGGLLLSGCTSTEGGGKLIEEGSLTACSEASYPPFEQTTGDKVEGIDADISAEIAKDLGVDLKQVNTAFEGLQSGQDLDNKKCDIAISAITITDERKTKMDFSDPYYHDDLAVITRKDSGITTVDEATDGTRKVGVQQATTGEDWANEHGLNPQQFEDASMAAESLDNGSIDVVIDQVAPSNEHLKKYPDTLVKIGTIPTDETYGIAVRKGNTELLDSVNATIERIEGDGTLDGILQKWGAAES